MIIMTAARAAVLMAAGMLTCAGPGTAAAQIVEVQAAPAAPIARVPAAPGTPSQGPEPAAGPAVPRVELGGGAAFPMGVSTEGDGGALGAAATARAGIRLSRTWALEGIFDVFPAGEDVVTLYRAQVRWQFSEPSTPAGARWHLTAGSTGVFVHETWPEHRWTDRNGNYHVSPSGSRWNVMAPIFPTIGIGVQKPLGARVALRADLAAVIVPYDDGAAFVLMPSVSLSFPIGRYPAAGRR